MTPPLVKAQSNLGKHQGAPADVLCRRFTPLKPRLALVLKF